MFSPVCLGIQHVTGLGKNSIFTYRRPLRGSDTHEAWNKRLRFVQLSQQSTQPVHKMAFHHSVPGASQTFFAGSFTFAGPDGLHHTDVYSTTCTPLSKTLSPQSKEYELCAHLTRNRWQPYAEYVALHLRLRSSNLNVIPQSWHLAWGTQHPRRRRERVPHHRTLGSGRGPGTAVLAFCLTASGTGFWRACRCTNRVAVVLGFISNRGTDMRHASTADYGAPILRGGSHRSCCFSLTTYLDALAFKMRSSIGGLVTVNHSETVSSFTTHLIAHGSS
ncbi:hypothetical protein P171DRAFT_501430 [Karstenula rhodostoma CBS 690.94]|uniref:Uncharacterized protein n=1 Tax=Karstenula rhodostoma CBS 690.94 TaxID=1392251 RepID=A0A9P4PA71_9PLEO|nr:hypothetical protein P171DRAFT_501430 [Karstenula rhodostoma CBS 690.94]